MNQGATDKLHNRKTISIRIGVHDLLKNDGMEHILVDDSNPRDIVIRVEECESLRIDFDADDENSCEWRCLSSGMRPVHTTALKDGLSMSGEARNSSEDASQVAYKSLCANDGKHTASHPFSSEFLSEQSDIRTSSLWDDDISCSGEFLVQPGECLPQDQRRKENSEMTPLEVPLAKVRWSEVPPPPSDARSRSDIPLEWAPGDKNDDSELTPVLVNPETLAVASSDDETDPVFILPGRSAIVPPPMISEAEEVLASVRTSFPGPYQEDHPRRLSPILLVTIGALLVMAGVVAFGTLSLPRRITGSTSPGVKGGDRYHLPADIATTSTSIRTTTPSLNQSISQSQNESAGAASTAGDTPASASAAGTEDGRKSEPHESTKSPGPANWGSVDAATPGVHDKNGKGHPVVQSERGTVKMKRNVPSNGVSSGRRGHNYADMTRTRERSSDSMDNTRDTGSLTGTHDGVDASDSDELPVRPSREDVRRVMDNLTPYIRNCKLSTPGRLVMELVFLGATGNVVSSEVIDGPFIKTATGVCANKVARTVQLPEFSQEKITIIYPFDI